MRTNIVLDDDLVAEALRTGIKTKRAVVEEAFRTLIRLKRQEESWRCAASSTGMATSTRCAATEPEPGHLSTSPRPLPPPAPFGGVAGTDSHGPMDHPKKALTRKSYQKVAMRAFGQ